MMRSTVFRMAALVPKVILRIRGGIFRGLVLAAGGHCGPGMRIESGFRLRQGVHPNLSFGRDIYFGRGTTIDCLVGAHLAIGANVTFTQGCFISVVERMMIGDNVLIGEYCSLRDANHAIDNAAIAIVDQPMVPAAVAIANNVWLGRGVAVLAGVIIGEGAVVGANAVVTQDIAPYAIAVGVPAKTIKSRLPH